MCTCFVFLVTYVLMCVTELEWPREAACAGRVDWQLWAHAGETHDAGDRTTVSERLHLTPAQRGKFVYKIAHTVILIFRNFIKYTLFPRNTEVKENKTLNIFQRLDATNIANLG